MSVLHRVWLLIRVIARQIAAWIKRINPSVDTSRLLEESQTLKRRLVDVATVASLLEQQAEKQRDLVRQLDDQAAQSLAVGQKDRARRAIERKTIALEEIDAIDRRLEETAAEERDLIRASAAVLAQVDAILVRQKQMNSRRDTVKSLVGARESLARLIRAASNVDVDLEQQQDDVWALEGRAAALDIANASVSSRSWPGKQIVEETGQAARAGRVEDELARLSRLSEQTAQRASQRNKDSE